MSRDFKDYKSAIIIFPAIAIVFLVIGLFPIKEHIFYIALRSVVFLVSTFLLFKINRSSSYFWVFSLVALLYNPFKPFNIDRLSWVFIEAATAGVFIFFLRKYMRQIKDEVHPEGT